MNLFCKILQWHLTLYEPLDSTAIISSWGTNTISGPNSVILEKIQLKIITDSECRTRLEFKRDYYNVVDSFLCLESGGGGGGDSSDICQQDEGSPIVCQANNETTEQSQSLFLCGIVINWSVGCGSGFPTMHSEISYFSKWILQFANEAKIYGEK